MPKRKGTDVSEFLRGIDRLDRAVGRGMLELGITMNQRYAKYQHERMDLDHPGGGKDHFLTDPLYEMGPEIMTGLARAAITREGSDLHRGATEQVELWADASRVQTPKWMGDLPNSHAPYVSDDGDPVYERKPKARRLTEDELRLKNRWNVHPSRRRGR